MRERTHAPVSHAWEVAHLETISFGENFVINACAASFVPLFTFFEAIKWFHADGNFILAADFQKRNQSVCGFVWNHDTVAILSKKNHDGMIWPVIGWNHFQGL